MAYTGDLNGKAAGAAGVVRRGTALAAGSAAGYAKAEAVVAEIGKERRVTAAKLAAARKSYAERAC
jgi:hypothetical protein